MRKAKSAQTPDELVAAHPLREAIDHVRRIIRETVPAANESVKWNAPSFATTEHFATFFLRHTATFQVVLHLGARPDKDKPMPTALDDPLGLLEWRGRDRAIVTFRDPKDVAVKAKAFAKILRQWVAFV